MYYITYLLKFPVNNKRRPIKEFNLFRSPVYYLIPNIFLRIATVAFGAFTTTIFITHHLRQISMSMPIAISNTQRTNTRKPAGNMIPRRIPTDTATAHITQIPPLLRHIARHRLSSVFCYILRKNEKWRELSL